MRGRGRGQEVEDEGQRMRGSEVGARPGRGGRGALGRVQKGK